MSDVGFAIHVTTGETRAIASVDRWLMGNRLCVARVNDPYAAVVQLLSDSREPAVVLVGADWLAASEYCLLAMIQQRHPNALIAVYGEGVDQIEVDGLLRLRDEKQLTEFLACPFAAIPHRATVREESDRRTAPPAVVEPGAIWPRRATTEASRSVDGAAEFETHTATLTPAEVATLLGEQKSPES